MGSPLGPSFENDFMGKTEKTSLKESINDLEFYGRHVDDLFCLTEYSTDIEATVRKFNSAYPSLRFSAEAKAANEIAFFDVLLRMQRGGSIQRRHGLNADKSSLLKDFRLGIVSCHVNFSIRGDDPSLRSVEEGYEEAGLVNLQFRGQLEIVTAPRGGLKPAEGLTGFGYPTSNLAVNSGVAG
ncbi:unnamed protein product [Dibothriocephalus latus]|uniref:Reverse transcriptase domain-containing protein n=1 Tax=Dibothriocephalus latus TaxID=60516 RepID=A0A3P6TEI1_DIBLA|nr:unnamed protein product [Dibothriocephalus latus]